MEAPLLLLFADLEPEFYEDDPGIDHVFFDLRRQFQETAVSRLVDETHHVFDAGAVVPAAVEDDDFASGGEMLDIALEKQLALLPFGRRGQGNDPEYSGAHSFRKRPNGATFARGIATLESDDDPKALLLNPFLQMTEFDLKLAHFSFIGLAFHPLAVLPGIGALLFFFGHWSALCCK